jgi:hypothetical protein
MNADMNADMIKQRNEFYDKVIDYAKQFRELNKLIEKRPITWRDRYKLNWLKSYCDVYQKPKVEIKIAKEKLENELFDYSNLEVLKKIKVLKKEYKMFIDSGRIKGLNKIIYCLDSDKKPTYDVVEHNDDEQLEYKANFFKAVMSGNYDLCKKLLDRGYYPNMEYYNVNNNDYSHYSTPTPIFDAIEFGHINICELLLDRGANYYTHDFKERTPLEFACEKGQVEVCEFFKYYTRDQKLKTYRRRQHLIAALES